MRLDRRGRLCGVMTPPAIATVCLGAFSPSIIIVIAS
jgi:hypothetical protein